MGRLRLQLFPGAERPLHRHQRGGRENKLETAGNSVVLWEFFGRQHVKYPKRPLHRHQRGVHENKLEPVGKLFGPWEKSDERIWEI